MRSESRRIVRGRMATLQDLANQGAPSPSMPSLSLPKSSVSKSSLFLVLASSERYTSVQNVCGISSFVMLVCSFHVHEEDGARPPPLSSHSFTDRNPFVLINMSGASVVSTCSGRHCVCHADPLGIRSETFERLLQT